MVVVIEKTVHQTIILTIQEIILIIIGRPLLLMEEERVIPLVRPITNPVLQEVKTVDIITITIVITAIEITAVSTEVAIVETVVISEADTVVEAHEEVVADIDNAIYY